MAYSLLLVDDEPGILNVLGIYLKDAGFIVQTVDNGKEASRMVKQGDFDIVLTDIRMPGLDGISLLKQIKKTSLETEVIMITGHGDYKLAIESLKLDAVDFITKPIDNDVLDIALKRATDRIENRKEIHRYTTQLEQMVKEKTAELETSRKHYAQLFNESPSFITIQDRDLNIVKTNRAFTEHIDFEEGMTCYQAYKKRQAPCDGCPVKKTFDDGQSHRAEMQIIQNDGRQRHIFIQTSGITDAAGQLTHVMEMATDITKIIDLQDHLASLGLHIGSISHGIKQVLTGVDGGGYLLESGLAKKDHQLVEEGWSIVKDKISSIRQMVLDILFHSKHRKPDKSVIQLKDLIHELKELIVPRAKKEGVDFRVHLPHKPVMLEVDKTAVMAALTSILENAVDACLADQKQDKIVVLDARVESNGFVLSIEDNGIGIKPDQLEKIFDPFYSKKGRLGTGLGLFIAFRAIRQHNGSIHAESTPGKFTRFIIQLPLK